MSYIKKFVAARPISTSGVSDWLQKGAEILKSAKTVLDDPALPEVTGMVFELNQMEKKGAKAGEPGVPSKGIGLRTVVKPLRAFVFYRKNTWILPVAIAGVIGMPFLLGFVFGRRGRR